MSAYIYKLRSPTRFSWMNVQIDPNITVTVKVYHMKFWYKPYAGMEEDNKLQKKLSREEKKTKKLFEDTDVRYAIISYEGHDISKPFVHGDFFGCWQVVDWKRLKKISIVAQHFQPIGAVARHKLQPGVALKGAR